MLTGDELESYVEQLVTGFATMIDDAEEFEQVMDNIIYRIEWHRDELLGIHALEREEEQ